MKQSKLTSLSLFIQAQLVNANNNNDGNGNAVVNLEAVDQYQLSRRNNRNRKRRLRGGQEHTQQLLDQQYHHPSIGTANNSPQQQHQQQHDINNNNQPSQTLQRANTNNNNNPNNPNPTNRKLVNTAVSPQYLQSHPWYPHHDALTCYNSNNNIPSKNKYPPQPPEWMTWSGGYAEAHLFKSSLECCLRWFPDVKGCVNGVDEAFAQKVDKNEEESLYGNDPSANWDANDEDPPIASYETSPTNANIEQMSGVIESTTTNNNWHLSPQDDNQQQQQQEEETNWADEMINSLVSTTNTGGGGKVGPLVEYINTAKNTATSTTTSGGGGKVGPGVEYTPPELPTHIMSANANANHNQPDIFWAVEHEEEKEKDATIIGSQQQLLSNFDQLTPTEANDNDYQDYLAGFANHGVEEQSRGHGVPLVTSSSSVNDDLPPPPQDAASWNEQTFPTSSCGTGWSHATTCSILCLSSSHTCPPGQTCFSGIPCPASQVATAMGNAGAAILQLVNADDEYRMNSVRENVCGVDYKYAERRCMAGDENDDGSSASSLGYSDDFERCNDQVCSGNLICYGDILCPLPPTISPAPTRSPVREYTINHYGTDITNTNAAATKGGGDGSSSNGHGKSIVAYYAAWQWYDRSKLAQPRNLNYHMVTRINYAFFNVNGDGEIYGTDDYADGQILFGDDIDTTILPGAGGVCSSDNSNASGDNDPQCYCHYTAPGTTRQCGFHDSENSGLIYLAHGNNVEVYVSVGGWTLSEAFPVLAGSQGGRENFAESCVKLILEYGFDGKFKCYRTPLLNCTLFGRC